MFLGISQNSQENTSARVSYIKKERHKHFPVNFAKFLRIPFFTEDIRCLLFLKCSRKMSNSIDLYLIDFIALTIEHRTGQKRSFPLRISSVDVTSSAENWGFGHIYWRNPLMENVIFCAMSFKYLLHQIWFFIFLISLTLYSANIELCHEVLLLKKTDHFNRSSLSNRAKS